MALISCPECNSEISDKAQSCPKCGAPVSTSEVQSIRIDPKSSITVKRAGSLFEGIGSLLVIVGIIGMTVDPGTGYAFSAVGGFVVFIIGRIL